MISERTDKGYAIAEMLASLLIFAMTATLMISGVSAGKRVWERMDADSQAADEVGGAQMLLRQRLERIDPLTLFDTIPPTADFDGESSTLSFVAPPRNAQAPSALRRYKLWLSPKGELVLSSASSVAIDPTKPDENLVLLTGVQALDLAYYGAPTVGLNRLGPLGWQLQWAHQLAPPTLIRVHLAFDSGDRRIWPDLLVKPVTNIDSQCVLNPATGRCRGRL